MVNNASIVENTSVVVEAVALEKVYGDGDSRVHALRGADLTLRPGEIVVIMGPSGSGKTTLLTILGGLLKPDTGSVRIGDVEVTGLPESELPVVRRDLIGYVFQSFNLLDSLTALENVEIALNIAGISGADARQRAKELLHQLDLGHRLHSLPGQMSGGEKQRVSIARALANDPELILADEPTGNLDSRSGHQVMTLMRQLAKQQNKPVLIVTHDQRVREIADRVLWLEDGFFREIDALETDPVCGMRIERNQAVRTSHQGVTYYF